MPKVDLRTASNTSSVIAMRDLLRLIIRDPTHFTDDTALLSSLRSQGRTASLSYTFNDADGERVITPVSLNTLKSHANQLFESGFEGFDELRLAAKEALTARKTIPKRGNKRTKEGLQLRVSELEEKLHKHKAINFLLLQAISRSISLLHNVRDAPNKTLREKRAQDGAELLRKIVSLNPPPWDELVPPTLLESAKDYLRDE